MKYVCGCNEYSGRSSKISESINTMATVATHVVTRLTKDVLCFTARDEIRDD